MKTTVFNALHKNNAENNIIMVDTERALSLMRSEYLRLDERTGADTSSIELKISRRLKRSLGYFKILYKGDASRKLSPKLRIVLSNSALRSYKLMYEVSRHEYAHALVFLRDPEHFHMHDSVWKAAAREVGCIPRASININMLEDNEQIRMDLSELGIFRF